MKNLNGVAKGMATMAVVVKFMRGVVTGTYAFVIASTGIDAEMFKIIILVSTLVGLFNFYIKHVTIDTVIKGFYISLALIVVLIPILTGVGLLVAFEILIEIKVLFASHIGNHLMDKIKNDINLRDYHALVDGLSTVSLLVGLAVGVGVLYMAVTPIVLCVWGTVTIALFEGVSIHVILKQLK